MAENADLQVKVASLTSKLNTKAVETEGIKGELNVDADEPAVAICCMTALKNTLRVCRS